ncbi:hypothetical protein BN7_271 [Wickerhamomyces ciferrii]|uniref:Uncharacterized protein n=1 Tax=Wickerhamomyces ciferrii (strain ATCC 14091 / BCRC 22168 / CBS 111 / JCM 3599 / NBRC 0793 / NRRL Y-1031 F-60-10) TaxID=1206466 RepID=K0KEU8_WICCF|nr:uncharacterized protein BN7_271 [Wickerhamomyces ciferrii]CCH40737.1 hypothetical protein BN7_271 [Wickerhamomyces ciferrii]
MTLNTMINTTITTILTPFLNKIIDTFHTLYFKRDIFEALGIWSSYPRGLCGLYISHSFYNTVYRPFWRLYKITFPIRYYLANRLKSLGEWIDYSKSNIKLFSIKKDEDVDLEGFEGPKINYIGRFVSNHNGNANDIKFPMEIWEIIASIGDINNSIMMSINKSFFYTFGPKIYDTLRFTIVLTPLTKMKLTDEAYLKNGPDYITAKYCDSYSIYKRHQESQQFDYEFLDTSIDIDQDYFKLLDHNDTKRNRHPILLWYKSKGFTFERLNQPFEVRSLKKIQFILKNVLQNPNSIMKKFIKEILLDVCVFDGFDKLITMKQSSSVNPPISGHESLEELIDQKVKNKENVSVMKLVNTDQVMPIRVVPLDDNFDRVRWKDSLEGKIVRFFKICNNIKNKLPRASIISDLRHIFPQNVYFKEMLCVYLLSDQLYSHRLRRRISKFQQRQIKYFQKANPIEYWHQTIKNNVFEKTTGVLDKDGHYRMTVTGQSCVKIQNREFKTKQQVYEIFNDLIETLTNIKSNDNSIDPIETSILMLGTNDGKPQVSKEFTENASYFYEHLPDFSTLRLEPQLILINKSATINDPKV